MAQSTSIRGSEWDVTVTVNAVVQGTLLLNDFSAEPDMDLSMRDYGGQRSSKGDTQYNGWKINFTVDEDDATAVTLMQLLVDAAEAGTTQPEINITARRRFRKRGVRSVAHLYPSVVMKPGKEGWSGRKEVSKISFEGFAETRLPIG